MVHPCRTNGAPATARRAYMLQYEAILERSPFWTVAKLKLLIPTTTPSDARFRGYPEYPVNDNPTPPGQPGNWLCFSYHVRGSCFAVCGRRGDHRNRNHSPGEQARAIQFLEAILAFEALHPPLN